MLPNALTVYSVVRPSTSGTYTGTLHNKESNTKHKKKSHSEACLAKQECDLHLGNPSKHVCASNRMLTGAHLTANGVTKNKDFLKCT